MYNEEENIEEAVSKINSIAAELTDDHEIVIVDDASTDGSAGIVERLAYGDKRIKLFRLEKNSKFGGAFAKGFMEAEKDVILYMDSDMPVALHDIKDSFPLIYGADIVTGYSKVKKGDTVFRKFVSGVYNLMVKVLFGLAVKDINSGYKIVSKALVRDIEFISRSPFIDVELFLHAKKKKARVEQFPLVFLTRSGGKSYIARVPVILATFIDMIKVKIRSCVKRKKKD